MLLQKMLRKLKEQGHRVLVFSQVLMHFIIEHIMFTLDQKPVYWPLVWMHTKNLVSIDGV